MNSSSGAIIRQDDKILLLDRTTPPYGWAAPAGHREVGETPEETLKREVFEETGLKIESYRLLFQEFVEWNECKRGHKGHDWHVYEILEWQGEVQKNSESKALGWVKLADIDKLELEPVWEYFFKKLKLI